jgi:hypothetical protein
MINFKESFGIRNETVIFPSCHATNQISYFKISMRGIYYFTDTIACYNLLHGEKEQI